MRNLFPIIALGVFTLLSNPGHGQDNAIRKNLLKGPQVAVEEATAMHGTDTEPSFNLTITGEHSATEKAWKKFVTDRYSFKLSSQRDFYQAIDVEMPDVVAGKVSVYSRVDKKGDEVVLVVMVKSDGEYISGQKAPGKATKLKAVLTTFGEQVYRRQYADVLEEDTKALGKIQKEVSSASRDVEKLSKEISKTERSIIDLETEIKSNDSENKKLQSGIEKVQASRDKSEGKLTELQEEADETVDPKKTEKLAKKIGKYAKKMGKADDSIEKSRDRIEKNNDRVRKLEQDLKEDRNALDRLKGELSKAEKDLKKVTKDAEKQEKRVNEMKGMSEKFGG